MPPVDRRGMFPSCPLVTARCVEMILQKCQNTIEIHVYLSPQYWVLSLPIAWAHRKSPDVNRNPPHFGADHLIWRYQKLNVDPVFSQSDMCQIAHLIFWYGICPRLYCPVKTAVCKKVSHGSHDDTRSRSSPFQTIIVSGNTRYCFTYLRALEPPEGTGISDPG